MLIPPQLSQVESLIRTLPFRSLYHHQNNRRTKMLEIQNQAQFDRAEAHADAVGLVDSLQKSLDRLATIAKNTGGTCRRCSAGIGPPSWLSVGPMSPIGCGVRGR